MTEDSRDNPSTLLAAELSAGPSVRLSVQDKLALIGGLRQENNRMQAENHVLRRQLYLTRENAGLRVANVVSLLVSWLDEQHRNGKTGLSPTSAASAQGNQTDLDETITGLLQSFRETMVASDGRPQDSQGNPTDSQGTKMSSLHPGDLDDTVSLFLQSLKQTLGGASGGQPQDGQASGSSGYGSTPPESYERVLPAVTVPTPDSFTSQRPVQNDPEVFTPLPRRRMSLTNPTPHLKHPHGYTLERHGATGFSRHDDPSYRQTATPAGQPGTQGQPEFQADRPHGHTWTKQNNPPAAPRIGAPLAVSTPTTTDTRGPATSTPAQLRPLQLDFEDDLEVQSFDTYGGQDALSDSLATQGYNQQVVRPPTSSFQGPADQTGHLATRSPSPNLRTPGRQAGYEQQVGHQSSLSPRTPEGQSGYSQHVSRPPTRNLQNPQMMTSYVQQSPRPLSPSNPAPMGQTAYGQEAARPRSPSSQTPRVQPGYDEQVVQTPSPSNQTPRGQSGYTQQRSRPPTPNLLTPEGLTSYVQQSPRSLSPSNQMPQQAARSRSTSSQTPREQTGFIQETPRSRSPSNQTNLGQTVCDQCQVARSPSPSNQPHVTQAANGSTQDSSPWQPGQSTVASPDQNGTLFPPVMAQPPAQVLNTPTATVSPPNEASMKYWQDLVTNPRTRLRLIGEVAYQLDRRVLSYVFGGFDARQRKKRFYGYIIKNIPEMITWEAMDPNTGVVDQKRQSVLEHRRRYIMHSLGPLGYRVDRHADFATRMVNKYGLLPVTPEQTKAMQNGADKNQIEAVLKTITPEAELNDVIILLDCLAILAQDDGKSIFVW